MWTIYVLGDAGYIRMVLETLAILNNANIFMQLGAVGALLGVIFIVAKGVADGGSINVGGWLTGIIVLLVMFSTTTTAVIENKRTGATEVVANVPLGPVAISSLISRIGGGTTEVLETAFSDPGITTTGPLTSLKALVAMRKMAYTNHIRNVDDPEGNGSRYLWSMEEYVANCTMYGLGTGNWKTVEDIKTASDAWAAMKYDNAAIMTPVRVSGPTKVNMDCITAHAEISSKIAPFSTYQDAIFEKLGILQSGTIKENEAGSDSDVRANLDAVGARISAGTVGAAELMMNSLMASILELGANKRYELDLHWAKAAAAQEAINQRISSWQTESTIFERFMLPMMTFLEGLAFAFSPFLAFALGFGSQGLGMAGKYFLVAIWIQCWMPMVAVVNQFITTLALGKMAAVDGTSAGFPSIDALDSLDGPLQEYMAVGSLMMSSVPILAAAVLFGAGQLIGKFGGMASGSGAGASSAHYTAPAYQNPAAINNMQGGLRSETSRVTGMTMAGQSSIGMNYSLGSMSQESVKSAAAAVSSARENYTSALRRSLGTQVGMQRAFSSYASKSSQELASGSATDQYVNDRVNALIASGAASEEDRSTLQGIVGASISAENPGWIKMKMEAGVRGGVDKAHRLASAFQAQSQETDKSGNTWESRRQSALQAALGSEKRDTLTDSQHDSSTKDLNYAREEVNSKQQNYERAASRTKTLGAKQDVGEATLANQIIQAGGLGAVRQAIQNQEAGGDVQRIKQGLIGSMFADTDEGRQQAEVAASLRVLSGRGGADLKNESDAQESFLKLAEIGVGAGLGMDKRFNAESNAGVAQGVEARVAGTREEAAAAAGHAGAMVDGVVYNIGQYSTDGGGDEFIDSSQRDLEGSHAAAVREVDDKKTEETNTARSSSVKGDVEMQDEQELLGIAQENNEATQHSVVDRATGDIMEKAKSLIPDGDKPATSSTGGRRREGR
jgi:conjugal transfer mating pair stabilization protein TraG